MILPDVNLLIYAVDRTSPFHRRSRVWWDDLLSSNEPVGLCYPAVLGFVRITTNRRAFREPLAVETALTIAETWMEQPNVVLLAPTERHWTIFADLLRSLAVGANLTTDAHIAAYAIERGATLCSNDSDFGRFDGLRWRNPLA